MTTATATNLDRYLKFVEKVSQDAELTRELKAVEPGDTARILELATGAGYTFTPEELHEASAEARRLADQGENELSDEQLEMVDGGSVAGWVLHKVRQAIDWVDDKVNGKPKTKN